MPRRLARGIALDALDALPACREASAESVERTFASVEGALSALPWFYRIPLALYDELLSPVCVLPSGRSLASQSRDERRASLGRLRAFPAFGVYRKLVRSLTFLRADYVPQSEGA